MRRLISLFAAIVFFIAPARGAQPPPPYPPGFGTQEAWIQTMLHLLYTGVGGILQVDGSGNVTAASVGGGVITALGKAVSTIGGFVPVSSTAFYVSATGLDTADCLAATVTGGHAPCLTVQHAVDVAQGYDAGGVWRTINIGAGTFQGPMITGAMRGAGGNGISGQYLVLNGVGNTTILTDLLGRAFVVECSDHATPLIENLQINIPAGETGTFVQNNCVLQTSVGITYNGASSTSIATHVEAGGINEFSSGVTITLKGALAYLGTMGQGGGYLEFDPGGGTILCSAFTGWGQEGFLATGGGNAILGTGWSFSGCGSVINSPYFVGPGGRIENETGSPLPGNNPGQSQGNGIFSPQPIPIIAATTGLGTGGSPGAAFVAGSGSHGGTIILTTGSGSTAASGTVQITQTEYYLMTFSNMASCSPFLQSGAAAWDPAATAQILVNTAGELQLFWADGGSNLTISTTYKIGYICHGDSNL